MAFSIVAFSCSNDDDPAPDPGDTTNPDDNSDENEDWETNTKDTLFVNAVLITYSNNAEKGIIIDNPFENQGVNISVNGGKVVVTSTIAHTEINYVLSGHQSDGCFKIYSDYKYGLGLNGVSLINSNEPAINIQSKEKASVYLVGGTSNRLIDNNVYEESTEDMKGTFFSEGPLTFQGSGKLTLKGYNRHAICSDDEITITSGDILIESSYKDGIHTNDGFTMEGGTLNITASSDGIECERGIIQINGGKIKINSEDYGIYCSYNGTDTNINAYIRINNGDIDILSSGQKSAGIRSRGTLLVNNGEINIETTGTAAKGINIRRSIEINGGNLNLTTKGDAMFDSDEQDTSSSSGIKSDENLTINNGNITITSSGSGGKGINIDGNFILNNGSVSLTTSGDEFVHNANYSTSPKALNAKNNATIKDGNLIIKTTGTKGKGIDCKNDFTIEGGLIEIETFEDCINVGSDMHIKGGSLYCNSANNDGIVSDETLTISKGIVISSGSSTKRGIRCKNSNTFKITGGTVIGTGTTNTIPSGSSSTQNILYYSGTGTKDQLIHIESASGNQPFTYKMPQSYSPLILLFSSPDLTVGTGYTIYTGGSVSGGTDFHGLYTHSNYTKGNNVATFSVNSIVTTVTSN